MQKSVYFAFIFIGCLVGFALASPTIWTARFNHVLPRDGQHTRAFCLAHTPDVIVTTIQQITRKDGIVAKNGVRIKYLSYATTQKDGLYFNLVKAQVSGGSGNGRWSMPMKLYEQTLTPAYLTHTVWSTSACKGMFTGKPNSHA